MSDRAGIESELSIHVFTVSAAMVGVCLTGIGLFRVYGLTASTIGDDLLAFDASLFAITCFLAFRSLRTRSMQRRTALQTISEWLFLIGLLLMVVVCLVLTYKLA